MHLSDALAKLKSLDFHAVIIFAYMSIWTMQPLLIKYSKTSRSEAGAGADEGPHPFVVTLLAELVKLVFAGAYSYSWAGEEVRGQLTSISFTNAETRLYIIPALLYGVYNVLWFVNLNYFSATALQVLLNIRIIFTALLWQHFFKKSLSAQKWSALFILMAGCMVASSDKLLALFAALFGFGKESAGSVAMALFLLLVQAVLSPLAGVYNEMALKSRMECHVMVQNVKLYAFTVAWNLVAVILFAPGRFTLAIGGLSWAIVLNMAAGGLVASMLLKYLSVVVKTIAGAAEMAIVALLSVPLFGTPLDFITILSIVVVSGGVYIYNVPKEESPVLAEWNTRLHASTGRWLLGSPVAEELSEGGAPSGFRPDGPVPATDAEANEEEA